jgi:hypothetical protein
MCRRIANPAERENSLGYSVEDLEAFSWKGINTSKAFKNYITSKSTANGTTYQEEYDKWRFACEKIQYKLVKSEDVTEQNEQNETPADEKK